MTSSETTRLRVRDTASVALAITSGATDAVSFLALGGAFTSVMTGNLVLLGIAIGHLDGQLAVQIAVAVVGYVAGTAAGVRIVGHSAPDDPVWPAAVTRGLLTETSLFLLYAVGWWTSGAQPGAVMSGLLTGLCAVALGVQSGTVRRFGLSGLSTTYLTGTLTSLVDRLATGGRLRREVRQFAILIGLIVGAAVVAVLLAMHLGRFVLVVQFVPLVAVTIASVRLGGLRSGGGRPAKDAPTPAPQPET